MANKTQGTRFQLEIDTDDPLNITNITSTNPPVVTSNAHGLTNGRVIRIANVAGMTQLNNRAFIVANAMTNTFELKGIFGTDYTAYESGGTAVAVQLLDVGEVTDLDESGGEAPDINTTNLRSTAAEKESGLQDFGDFGFKLNYSSGDLGQIELRRAKSRGIKKAFVVLLTDGRQTAFIGTVKKFTFASPANDAYRCSCSISIASEPSFLV